MHLSYTLLVAITAVTFLSSGNVSATAGGCTRELSALVSPKVVASIDTNVGREKRYLRSTGRLRYRRKTNDETDTEPLIEDEDEADEEETDEEDSDEEDYDDAECNGHDLF
ncbi:hypothetical protein P3T76_006112 [Phytophthora citrophthora]|uniref:RxLR effector protein n=1 Tax=Phytophthora citrophthora TaxID=4793 RepID=A0AAD9GQX8_9STRA|nr:hypothetical protein P3T76_006112 [Phytophthora citrophthora]